MDSILAVVLASFQHLGGVVVLGVLTAIGSVIKNIVNVLTKNMWARFTAVVFPLRT